MTPNEKLAKIQTILDDYYTEMWSDPEIRDNLLFLLGRFIAVGQDITDEELDTLYTFLNTKVEEYVRTKAN